MIFKNNIIYHLLIISILSSYNSVSQGINYQNVQVDNCRATILNIQGGLPQTNSSEEYTINVTDNNGNRVSGRCGFGAILFDQDYSFQVGQSGMYNINISDGAGLDTMFPIDINCNPIQVDFGAPEFGDAGDTICQDYTVDNLTEIVGIFFQVLYDSAILKVVTGTVTPNPALSSGFLSNDLNPGVISVSYFGSPVTLPDGSALFSACFVLKGAPGFSSGIAIDPTRGVEFVTSEGCLIPTDPEIPGVITINSGIVPGDLTPGFGGCSTTSNLGAIILGPYNGVPPFSFEVRAFSDLTQVLRGGNISDNQTRVPVLGLDTGTYRVTIISGDNSEQVVNVIIHFGREMQAGTTVMDPTCADRSDGSVLANPTQGGVNPYSLAWFDPDGILLDTLVNSISNLPNGDYTLEVTDANGCVMTSRANVNTSPVIPDILTLMQPTCPGSGDGELQGESSGGTFPRDLTWEYGSFSETINNAFSFPIDSLQPGVYTLIATDDNGCIGVDSINLLPALTFDADSLFTDVTCFGRADGTITLVPPPNNNTITYLWDDGFTDSARINLPAGTYTVVVQETLCSDTLTFEISSPDSVSVVVDSLRSTPFLCNGDSTGQIILEIESGITSSDGLSIQWTNNVAVDAFQATNVPAGIYRVLVTTGPGCTDSVFFNITEVPAIQFTFPPTAIPDCPGGTTLLTVDNVTGGVGAGYTFTVDGGAEMDIGTIVPVFAGMHLVEVMDSIGCDAMRFETIDEALALTINLPETLVIDLGDSTQVLNPDIRPIAERNNIVSYEWTPPLELACSTCEMTAVYATDSREYTLTITDNRGCQFSQSVFVEVKKSRNVFFPDVFSPSGDGINDVYSVITGRGVQLINYFRIYNRWGVLVYEEQNISPGDSEIIGWDGVYQGIMQNPGVYVYVAEVSFIDNSTSSQPLTFKGNLTLIK